MLHEDIQVQAVKLVKLVPSGGEDAPATIATAPPMQRLLDRLPLLGLVVLPTLLAAFYFFGLAAARFQSEVTYVVRTPGGAATSAITAMFQGSSVTRSTDDAYLAKEYMLSRDAMQKLADHDGLMAMFSSAGSDILWRYPLFGGSNHEDLLKHYRNFVSVEYDSSSGVSTVKFQAFDAADAQRLAGALVAHTETFLNGMNGRAQADAIASAVADVDEAKRAAYETLGAMTAFRNAEETVDPTKASTGIVAAISSLSLQVSTNNARLAELMTNTPQSPEIPTLRTRISALQDQIAKQRQQLGGDTTSLAPRIERYQRLMMQQQFAEKSFMSSLASLESARLDATKQRVFLEAITTPDRPDQPAAPYRVLGTLGVLAVGLMLWRVAGTIGKDTREHGRR